MLADSFEATHSCNVKMDIPACSDDALVTELLAALEIVATESEFHGAQRCDGAMVRCRGQNLCGRLRFYHCPS